MAVQAQYPSNVLLLNRNNGQEGNDYALQQQTGGFLDQTHMLFNNNGGSNPRKRGREMGINNFTITSQMNPNFHLQNQPQISPLQNQQQNQLNVVSTGLRLSFGEQQQQQFQQNHHRFLHHHQQQEQQNIASNSSEILSLLSEDFTTQIKRQKEELNQFLQAQAEQLRLTLSDKRQKHYRALLDATEEALTRKLSEKENEMEKATRFHAELEARAARLSFEAQLWHTKAKEQEVTAASLQTQLQQAITRGGGGGGGGYGVAQDSKREEEGYGCYSGGGGLEGQAAEDAESVYVDPERVMGSGPICKGCRKQPATVLVLPCRHFSLCMKCDRVAQACPICRVLKNSSVEVFLS